MKSLTTFLLTVFVAVLLITVHHQISDVLFLAILFGVVVIGGTFTVKAIKAGR